MLEFRLLYQGELLGASRDNKRPEEKHKIRQEFHRQLKRLWITKHPLRDRMVPSIPRGPLNAINSPTPEGGFISYHELLAQKFSYFGYSFIPIVTEDLFLTCSLDILFLRPEEPSLLIEGGDIDNRVKTIFDSLRMPTNGEASALKGKFPPNEDEKPMYCLLRDDKLVSEVKVTADHLLLLPGSKELEANDVFLVVHVKVKPTRLTNGNLDFA